jgi:branched-chain amino acid transport system substrate-binding protein
LPVDYVGATGVELDAAGTAKWFLCRASEVIAGAFTTVTVHITNLF